MRNGISLAAILLAFADLGVCCGVAQEALPLPLPDPLQPGLAPQAPPSTLPQLVPSPSSPLGPIAPNPSTPIAPYSPSPFPGGYGPGGYSPPGGYGPGGYTPGGFGPGGMQGYGPPPPGYFAPPLPPPPGYYGRRAPILVGDPAGNPNIWLGMETLVWWAKGQPLSVPVVTTGPGSLGSNAGGLGVPGTASLNRPLNYGAAAGIRATLGGWCDPAHQWGVEGSIFSLGQQNSGFSVNDHSQIGNTVLNEPVAGAPFVTQVSAPGVETGNVMVGSSSTFWGADLQGLYNLYRTGPWTVNLLAGFKYLQLDEHVDIVANSALFTNTVYTDNLGNTLATAPPGSTVTISDSFGVRNQFYGGQAGVRVQYMMNRWSFNGTGTLAMGSTHESVTVDGSTNVYPVNSQPVYLQGGNYATLQTGTYTANHFAVAPGVNLNVGYQFTPFIRGTVGYNFLYLSSVARPGNQIDNTYDGTVHPLVPMVSSSYWAQGMTFGLQFSF